jgi:hypothetical protein
VGLDEVVLELYGLDASQFVSVRDARAREARDAGDRGLAGQIKALKRPSAAAWVVNVLVRQRAEEVERLLRFGESFRRAQAELAGDELRRLGRDRHQVVGALARESGALAEDRGRPVSEAVRREVESTLDAALADEGAAAAVRSGRLTRSLAHAGMGSVDLGGAVAAPDLALPALKPAQAGRGGAATAKSAGAAGRDLVAEPTPREKELAAARDAMEEAEAEVGQADHGLSSAQGAVADAERRRAEADERVQGLEDQLARARERARTAAEAVGRANEERQGAQKRLAGARRQADRARRQLARLE